MEIKLRTADEFHAGHVTIEIHADRVEAVEVVERLYTAKEVGDLQASEAQLVAAPLQRRINELQAERIGNAGTITALEQKVAELERKVRAYDEDRRTERDRADNNKAWAERTEVKLADTSKLCEKAQRHAATAQEAREIETRRANQAEIDLAGTKGELRRLRQVVSERFTRDQVQAAKEDARADERASWERRLATESRVRESVEARLESIRGYVNRPGVDAWLEDHEELGRIIAYVRDVVDPTNT